LGRSEVWAFAAVVIAAIPINDNWQKLDIFIEEKYLKN
jgi:hypothetical protein